MIKYKLSSASIPQFYGLVETCGGDESSVGGELDVVHHRLVAPHPLTDVLLAF